MTRSNANGWAAAALAAVVLSLTGAATHPPLTTSAGAVASDSPGASLAGARVLGRGGNAIDAAAATALALGVLNPSSSGIGGGGFAVVWVAAEKKTYIFDFRETAPAALTPESFVVDGVLRPELSRSGGLAVGVPGEVAGLEAMWKQHGALPWAEVVEPARRYAASGFKVHWFFARAAAIVAERLPADSPFRRWLSPGGKSVAEGRRVRRSALAATLARIAESGAAGFYRGEVAADLLAAIAASGGVMTAEDLAGYRVLQPEALRGRWRNYEIVTMPLPSSGGLLLLEMLGVLEASHIDLATLGAGSSAALHVTAEILKHGFADRARLLGDDAAAASIADKLLEPERLAKLAKRIDLRRTLRPSRYGDAVLAGRPPPDDGGTSHLCVIDAAGNAVALTTTVNGYFGAQIIAPNSGVVLNNEMDDFSLAPGQSNMFGLVQSDLNLIGPGKRPLSSMTPTLVLKKGEVVGCFGGSGGPRIISNTFQAILNVFVFGKDVAEAVSAPRIHHQWTPDELLYEPMPADVVTALKKRGHALKTIEYPTAVQAIVRRPDDLLEAASDPRKAGRPAAAEAPRASARPPG